MQGTTHLPITVHELSYKITSQKLAGSPTHITPVIILQIVIPQKRVEVDHHSLWELFQVANRPATSKPMPAPNSP